MKTTDPQVLMDDFFTSHHYDVTEDWRTTPATFTDPDDELQISARYAEVLKGNDRHHPAGTPIGGQFAPKDTLPAEPGTVPIPMGMIRLYHQTGEDNIAPIMREGIRLDRAKGIEGPRAIYADSKGFYGKPGNVPTIEFFVPEDKWQPPFVTLDEVPKANIIASHLKWHGHARYIENDPEVLANTLAGKHDFMLDDPAYGPAIRYIKAKHKVRKFNPLHEPAGNSKGGQFAFKEYDLAHEEEVTTRLAAHFERHHAEDSKSHVVAQLADRLKDNPDVFALSQVVMQVANDDAAQMVADMGREKYVKYLTLNAMNNLIKNWAGTSSDTDVVAHVIQEAIQEEFDLPKTTLSALKAQTSGEQGFSNSLADLRRQLHNPLLYSSDGKKGSAWAGLRAFVRAQYDLTQEEFKRLGITEVTLSRGMKVNVPFKEEAYKTYVFNAYVGDVKAPNEVTLMSVRATDGTAVFKSLPASSWSYNDSVASSFSTANLGKSPMVLTAKIPVTDIISTSRTGFGSMNEGEMVVLGRSRRAQYVAVNAKGGGADFERREANALYLIRMLSDDVKPGGGRVGIRRMINRLRDGEAKKRSIDNLKSYLNLHRNEAAIAKALARLKQWGYEGVDQL